MIGNFRELIKQLERNVVRMWAAVSRGGGLRDETKTAARETSKFMHRLGMTVRVPTKPPIIAKMPK